MKLLLNGKFLGRPLTGVDRYAIELASRISVRLAAKRQHLGVALPASVAHRIKLPHQLQGAQAVSSPDFGKPALWEQLVLPFVRNGSMLLSLCNIGPLFRANQCVMIADAQFITQASSYSWMFRTWYRLALPVLARRAKLVVTISQYSLQELERFQVIPAGKGHVVPCGIDHVHDIVPDLDVLDRHGLTAGSFLLMIGSRARHKNVGPVLAALRGKLPGGARIVLVGGGNSRIFADEGIEPGHDVLMTGRVTDEELVALYQNARAFLFPSLTEGFGLPPAEAMALGCPVIATDRGAVPEVMGDACIYVDPSDGAAWVDAVRRVWDDPALRADLTAKGLVRAQAWTWDRAADHLMALLADHRMT